MNEREVAFDILQRVELESAFAAPLLERATTDPRQLNFLRTLVLGVLRWRSRLDYVAAQFAARSAEKIDQPALQILRLGLFQIMFTDVPRHAAVNETVAAAGTRVPRARGFVNAVLRRATRTDSLLRLVPAGVGIAETLAIRESHPLWIVQRWIDAYGVERAQAILKANQELSQPDLLVNSRKTSRNEAELLLAQRGVSHAPSPFLDDVIRLKGPSGGLEKELEAGLFYPMDEGSAAIASLVPVQGKTVVDLAAAPGGKSVVLRLHDGHVVSCDVSLTRLQTLRRTSGRMFEVPPSIVVADARLPPFRKKFDVVLLDAPCSATGTIRRNPEIKWRVTMEQIANVSTLQKSMLAAALAVTGAICIYSTCSLEREENDDVIAGVLEHNKEFERIDLRSTALPALYPWIDNGVLRLTPESGTDGFTAFALQRKKVPR